MGGRVRRAGKRKSKNGPHAEESLPFEQTVLLLQGGGALGPYQAGFRAANAAEWSQIDPEPGATVQPGGPQSEDSIPYNPRCLPAQVMEKRFGHERP